MDGTDRQRKRLIVHVSQLVPFDRLYIKPEDIGVSPDTKPDPEDLVPPPDARATREKKRQSVAINNTWELAKYM
jgi:hypothetical protein